VRSWCICHERLGFGERRLITIVFDMLIPPRCLMFANRNHNQYTCRDHHNATRHCYTSNEAQHHGAVTKPIPRRANRHATLSRYYSRGTFQRARQVAHPFILLESAMSYLVPTHRLYVVQIEPWNYIEVIELFPRRNTNDGTCQRRSQVPIHFRSPGRVGGSRLVCHSEVVFLS